MEETNTNNPPRESITRGYELTTIRLRWLATLLIGIVILAIAWHTGVWFLMKRDARMPREVDAPRSIVGDPQPVGDFPRVQPTPAHDQNPPEDLAFLRAREDLVFEQLGWKRDAQTGAFHPPADLIRAVAAASAQPATTTQSSGGAP